MRWLILCFAVIWSLQQVNAQTNRAFIVGVGNYAELEDLDKTIGDLEGYSDAFSNALNFRVTKVNNPTHLEFFTRFSEFVETIEEGDQVAFVFSGHGWSNGSENFLALSDAPLESTELTLEKITASWEADILNELSARNPSFVFGIIDACRENPFDLRTRSVARGMVPQLSIPPRSMVIYSAGTNQTALDNLGERDTSPYSVFTRNLLPNLRDPNQPLMLIADKTRTETTQLALRNDHAQRPAIYSDVSLDFCLSGTCISTADQAREMSNSWDNIDEDALRLVKTNSQELLTLALQRHPLEEIVRAADRGNARASYLVGRSFFTPMNNEEADLNEAIRYFRSGCELGFGPSCTNLAALLLYNSVYGFGLDVSNEEIDAARNILRRECSDEDMTACLTALAMNVRIPIDFPKIDAALKNLEFRCRSGLKLFCDNLVTYLEGLRDLNSQYRVAVDGLIRGCEWGYTFACYAVAREVISLDRQKGSLIDHRELAFEFAKRSCGTIESTDLDGCEILASAHQDGIGTNVNLAEAERLRIEVCDRNHALSCRNLGVAYNNGLYGRSKVRLAPQLHRKACRLGDQDSCSYIR